MVTYEFPYPNITGIMIPETCQVTVFEVKAVSQAGNEVELIRNSITKSYWNGTLLVGSLIPIAKF